MCVCCSPVLSERSEIGDLQRVCIWLVVFLKDNCPRLFLSILLHNLLKRDILCYKIVYLLLFFQTKQGPQKYTCRHTDRRTCPSTIHRDMAVLPSGPGRNRSVAVRGLMLEMTKLDGAPGSSADRKNRENTDLVKATKNYKLF